MYRPFTPHMSGRGGDCDTPAFTPVTLTCHRDWRKLFPGQLFRRQEGHRSAGGRRGNSPCRNLSPAGRIPASRLPVPCLSPISAACRPLPLLLSLPRRFRPPVSSLPDAGVSIHSGSAPGSAAAEKILLQFTSVPFGTLFLRHPREGQLEQCFPRPTSG